MIDSSREWVLNSRLVSDTLVTVIALRIRIGAPIRDAADA